MARKRQEKKPITPAQVAVWLFVGILIMVVANLVVLLARLPSDKKEKEQAALFGVKTIEVVGNTRYDPADIITCSGIYEGQSVFSVDKKTAANRIQKEFAYAEEVTVDTQGGMDRLVITVKEATPLGVVNMGDRWMLVSTTGRGLQAFEKGKDAPLRYLQIEGATAKDREVGGQILDKRSHTIVSTLQKVLAKYKLAQLSAIDMTDKTDIRAEWNNQITFLLGNDANLEHKVAVIASTMPEVMKDYGKQARGTLNVRDYSDDDVEKKYIVFRPEGLVPVKPTTTTSTTGTGTDASATDTTATSVAEE